MFIGEAEDSFEKSPLARAKEVKMTEKDLKKSWEAPELIVLVRSKSEEGVLFSCKDGTKAGPQTDFATCDVIGDCSGSCSDDVGS